MNTVDLTPIYCYVIGLAFALLVVWLMWQVLPDCISNYIDEDLDIHFPVKGEAVPVKAHLLPEDEYLIEALCRHMSEHVTIAYAVGHEGMDWTYRFTEQDLLRTLRAWYAERAAASAV